ncbi:MAG: hypothetical protein Q9169_007520 [Polycauliona sp. 2 TL-2023]
MSPRDIAYRHGAILNTALHYGRQYLEELDRVLPHQAKSGLQSFLTQWLQSSDLETEGARLETVEQWVQATKSAIQDKKRAAEKAKRGEPRGKGRERGNHVVSRERGGVKRRGRAGLSQGGSRGRGGHVAKTYTAKGSARSESKSESENESEGESDEADKEEQRGGGPGLDKHVEEDDDIGADDGTDGRADDGTNIRPEDGADNRVDDDADSDADGEADGAADDKADDEADDEAGDDADNNGADVGTDDGADERVDGHTSDNRRAAEALTATVESVVQGNKINQNGNRSDEGRPVDESRAGNPQLQFRRNPDHTKQSFDRPEEAACRINQERPEEVVRISSHLQSSLTREPPVQVPSATPTASSSKNTAGIDLLAIASQIHNPLRLTSSYRDRAAIYHTVEALLSIPENGELSRKRQNEITEFVTSIYNPRTYWVFHDNIIKVIRRTGYANAVNDIDRRISTGTLAGSSAITSDPGTAHDLDPPKCLVKLVDQWRNTVQFSHQSATPTVARMAKMRKEEQLYIYWRRIRTLWKDSDPDWDPENPYRDGLGAEQEHVDGSDDDDEGPLMSTTGYGLDYDDPSQAQSEAEALAKFLRTQMEQRKEELHLKRTPRWEKHTLKLLRSLLAPLLGLDETERMWSTTIGIGKAVHLISQSLGWGALAVVKRENVRLIGSPVFKRILPVICTHDPQLKGFFKLIERSYLQPLQGPNMCVRKEDVENFLAIKSQEELIRTCAVNEHGLSGILRPSEKPISNGQGAAVEANIASPPSTAAPPPGFNDDDEDAIYSLAEILGPDRTLVAETENPLGRHYPGTGPTALPTPPTTTGRRSGVKRGIGHGSEESPTKRR